MRKHKQGYNCCQAVFCNYADVLGLDEATAFRVAEGFGFGLGGQREVCGAVSGMTMVAGYKNSLGGVENGLTKKETYQLVNKMIEEFKQEKSSAICKELLGEDGMPKPIICDGCIEEACLILEKHIFCTT